MSEQSPRPAPERALNRRELLETMGKAAVVVVAWPPFLRFPDAAGVVGGGASAPLVALAGPDRVVVTPGRTYLNGWAGYGEPPWRRPRGRPGDPVPAPEPGGPDPTVSWSRESAREKWSSRTVAPW